MNDFPIKYCYPLRETNLIPANVVARQETTAEEILRRLSNEILKPMFTIINSKGSRGAPSHPGNKNKCKVNLCSFLSQEN
jgi:hypothetical protein